MLLWRDVVENEVERTDEGQIKKVREYHASKIILKTRVSLFLIDCFVTAIFSSQHN